MRSRLARAHVAWGGMLLSLWVGCSSAMPVPPGADPMAELSGLEPHPSLSPDEVVRIQVEALRHNDDADRGIEIAYRFASPANKGLTGPLPRFARMIRNEAYRPLLNHRSARLGELQVTGDLAVQPVTLIDATGRTFSYVFALRRLSIPSCAGCWFTGAVTPEPGEPEIRAQARGASGDRHLAPTR